MGFTNDGNIFRCQVVEDIGVKKDIYLGLEFVITLPTG